MSHENTSGSGPVELGGPAYDIGLLAEPNTPYER